MLKLQKVTPLQFQFQSDEAFGTGRYNKLEIVPYTPSASKRLGLNLLLEVKPALNALNPDITQLRNYQYNDVCFLASRTVGANFSEPRTGKTPTILSVIKQLNLKKVIVVCPASAVLQWQEEYEKWTGKPCTNALAAKQKRIKNYDTWTHGLIIGYETLRVDIEHILKFKDIDCVIIDEAHRIKTPRIPTTEAVLKLSKIPYRYALTGTPAPNKQEEICNVLRFLFPNIFTGYWRFIDYYFETVQKTNYATNVTYRDIVRLRKDREQELQEFLYRTSVRHTRKEVMQWLPDKDYQYVRLPLTQQQKKYTQELTKYFETEHVVTENILTNLMRIRQVCQAPALLDLAGDSPKLNWLKTYIKDYPAKPILIFSNFTSFLKLISKELNIPYMIIGETPTETRNKYRKMFQDGKISILLINIKAGKEALTLDRAEAAIFLDAYPPYGDVEQAENRFTATTEDKKSKEHTIIRVCMKDSYDEELFKIVDHRGEVVDVINNFKIYLERR